jgi:hypothetical protein
MRRSTTPCLALLFATSACDGGVHYIGADCVPTGTDVELQTAVDRRDEVLLCSRAVFTLSAPLVLRQGVSLETTGRPTDARDMATVRLGADFPAQSTAAIVSSGSDIHLNAVRFDGNGDALGPRPRLAVVELGPGQGYDVEGCVFTASSGWTHLHLLEPCSGATVSNNVVASSPRPHVSGAQLVDGFSLSCGHSRVERNRITDVSSTGIVYFGGPGTSIRDNVFVQETTSANSAINLGDAVVQDHGGVAIEGNTITATGDRYFHVGIAVGLHVYGKTTTIMGPSVRDNTLSGMMRYGVAVDGCLDCAVQSNTITAWHPLPTLDSCPGASPYVAAVGVGHAGGKLQSGYTDVKVDDCLGEPDVLGAIYRDYAGSRPFPDYLAFEVKTFSDHLEQGLDAQAMLRSDWDAVAARAKALCPGGDAPTLQSVWVRLAKAQYADGLSPDDADARVRSDLAGSEPPCVAPP